jgi:hypothetical protein
MNAGARKHPEIAQHLVIGERIRDSGAYMLEQQKEAVRTINFAAVVRDKEITSSTIVSSPDFRGADVPQPLYQLRAVDDVGEEQRARSRRVVRRQAYAAKLLGIERVELIHVRGIHIDQYEWIVEPPPAPPPELQGATPSRSRFLIH